MKKVNRIKAATVSAVPAVPTVESDPFVKRYAALVVRGLNWFHEIDGLAEEWFELLEAGAVTQSEAVNMILKLSEIQRDMSTFPIPILLSLVAEREAAQGAAVGKAGAA